MKLQEISKPITSAVLNENVAQLFGQKIDTDKFTLEQLQDVRNKIRTRLSQVETNESFDVIHNDEHYQKNRLFLDILNKAIAEREDVGEAARLGSTPKSGPKGKKPDFLDLDKDGDKEEPMKKAAAEKDKEPAKDKEEGKGLTAKQKKLPPALQKAIAKKNDSVVKVGEAKKRKEPPEPKYKGPKYQNRDSTLPARFANKGITKKNEAVVREGEEDKAELVMAAKDMVDRITSWMEDTAEMQSESMLELGDAIRDEMGSQQSEGYIQSVKPALEELYTSLEGTRAALTQGVALLTGEEMPEQPMGSDEPMADDPMAEPDMEPTVGDDFEASDPAMGGDEPAGRTRRESIELSRKLGQILSSKKK